MKETDRKPDSAESLDFNWVARGTSYPGEQPGTTEFSGALFDASGNLIARHVHAVLPFVFAPKSRGRPPKDVRDALALVAAFELHLIRQQIDGYKPKKTLAYASLGYADDRAARAALTAARGKINQLMPAWRWSMGYIPNDPKLHINRAALPELGGRDLFGFWGVGEGDVPEIGKPWRGRAVAVFVPVGFEPRKERAAVRLINRMKS